MEMTGAPGWGQRWVWGWARLDLCPCSPFVECHFANGSCENAQVLRGVLAAAAEIGRGPVESLGKVALVVVVSRDNEDFRIASLAPALTMSFQC